MIRNEQMQQKLKTDEVKKIEIKYILNPFQSPKNKNNHKWENWI